MTVTYDEIKREITQSMPGYVQAALKRFQITRHSKPTHSPAPYKFPAYGKHVQYVSYDDSAPLSPSDTTNIQKVIGTFLYYARASTVLC